MKLSAFKELILKKASDESLIAIIEHMSEALLAAHVIESLQKADARKSARAPINDLAETVMHDDTYMHGIRDAMGHHAARFGAAVAAGKKAIADRHAHQWVKYNYLAEKMDGYFENTGQDEKREKLGWKPPAEIKAWQAGMQKSENHPKIKPNDPYSSSVHSHDDRNNTGGMDIPGWQFCVNKVPKGKDFTTVLTNPPAPHKAGPRSKITYTKDIYNTYHTHPEKGEKVYHNGPYPMEHVKFGGRYPDIKNQNTENPDTYIPHPFDAHPAFDALPKPKKKFIYNEASGRREEETDEQYANRVDNEYSQNLSDFENHWNDFLNSEGTEQRFAELTHPDHGSKPHYGAVHGKRFDNQEKFDVEDAMSRLDPKYEKESPSKQETTSSASSEHTAPTHQAARAKILSAASRFNLEPDDKELLEEMSTPNHTDHDIRVNCVGIKLNLTGDQLENLKYLTDEHSTDEEVMNAAKELKK